MNTHRLHRTAAAALAACTTLALFTAVVAIAPQPERAELLARAAAPAAQPAPALAQASAPATLALATPGQVRHDE